MAVRITGTDVITDARVLQNVTGLKTVGGNAILGSGDISTGVTPLVTTYDASTTWTKPNPIGNYAWYKVEIWGGGGGGGTAQPGFVAGGGGGGGGYWSHTGPLSELDATETVTVGAGASAKPPGNNQDGNGPGGASSFTVGTTVLTVYGGGGGKRGPGEEGGGGSVMGAGVNSTPSNPGSDLNGGFDVGLTGGAPGNYGRGNTVYGGGVGAGGFNPASQTYSLFGGRGGTPTVAAQVPGGGGTGISTPGPALTAGAPGRVRITLF